MKAPPITERDFQQQVTDLAELCGWEWAHCRAGRTLDSWRTPMSGTMAKGWPDLVLIRGSRIIFAELKRDGGKPTADQRRVLDVLGKAAEAYVWTPKDWDFIERELR